MPTDAELEHSFRKAVRAYLKNPTDVAPSVNSLRERVEKEFDLDDGFFRNGDWKSRSKDIIQDEYDQGANNSDSDAAGKSKNNGTKRASTATSTRPRKKSKTTKSDDEEEEMSALSSISSTMSDIEEDFDRAEDVRMNKKTTKSAKEKKGQKPQSKKARESDSDEEGPALTKPKRTSEKTTTQENDDSSSELSSVIDDLPPPSKTKKTSSSQKNGASKSSKSSTTKSSTKSGPDVSPDAEEIKRLQGWLVKCGIRKVWGKELKPYETPKAKIAHLKSMLADAGMTGRYSSEKAAQIKEARELAADIEAVQEGNERWGKTSDSENDDGEGRRRSDAKGAESSKTGRRLVRGAKNYDFLSSDGEETD